MCVVAKANSPLKRRAAPSLPHFAVTILGFATALIPPSAVLAKALPTCANPSPNLINALPFADLTYPGAPALGTTSDTLLHPHDGMPQGYAVQTGLIRHEHGSDLSTQTVDASAVLPLVPPCARWV